MSSLKDIIIASIRRTFNSIIMRVYILTKHLNNLIVPTYRYQNRIP